MDIYLVPIAAGATSMHDRQCEKMNPQQQRSNQNNRNLHIHTAYHSFFAMN